MNPNDIAPMMLGIVFVLTVAGVILLRPISKKLGEFLEVLAQERRAALKAQPLDRADAARITDLLENVDRRLSQIEDRQEFTDKLLVERPRKALSEPQ